MRHRLQLLLGILACLTGWALPAAAAQIGPSQFDHLTTGYELLGAHLNVPCESCHVGAIFKGTPRDCASCHSQGARVTATFKGQNHVLSSNRCDACHTDVAWMPAAHFDHQEVQGSCAVCHNGATATGKGSTHITTTNDCAACHSVFGWNPVIGVDHTQVNGTCGSCHNGRIATGKPATHIATSDGCDNCHGTLAWKPANVMHTGNIGNCYACHNGTIATGKPATHIATSNQCAACHSVVAWKPQTTVDHTQVIGSCYSCHNGTTATGKGAQHPANTDNTCENCHVTTAWTPANVNHNGITNNCAACHNGTVATGKPATHIATSAACQACHSVLVWKPAVTVDHTQVQGACASCHNGRVALGRPANHIPAFADCGVCHASTVIFGPGTVMNHTGITGNCASCHETGMSWVGVTMVDRPTKAQDANHPATGDCSQCHASTTSFNVDISGGKPANHIPTVQACTLCHSNSANYAVYAMNHAGITGNCAQCHAAGLSFANIVPKEPPANHIPISGLACENCHSPTNFTAFGPGTAMSHTGITSNCASCHETGRSWYGVTMVDRPTPAQDASHPTTGDCSQCHSSTTSFSVASAGKPANHIPTTQACTLCHSNSGNYAVYSMNHAGITGNCAQCHAAGLSFANIVPKEPPGNHIPIGGLPCENCHSPTNFGAFGPGTAMNHTGITANCASCHETGMSWYGVTMVDRPTAAQDPNHPKTGECSNCHSSTVSFSQGVSGGTKPSNHIPTSQPCTLCHTTAGNYAAYVMNHQGITGNCAQCHATGLSFANIVPKQPPSNHIPTGAIACEGCHATSVPVPPVAGGFGPSTPMNHSVVSGMACDACHERGMNWYVGSLGPMTYRPNGHHTGQDCKGCHSTTSFNDGGAAGNAVKPGPGGTKSIQTVTVSTAVATPTAAASPTTPATPTVATARTVATTRPAATVQPPVFNLAGQIAALAGRANSGASRTFTHVGTGRNCATCHNGLTAAGKGPRHIPSDNNCANCHTTIGWVPARFEHRGVFLACAACHDSVHATGKPAHHVPTILSCNNCHSTMAWLPVIFRHSGITGSCQSCHNGIGAAGKPLGHMVTARDCALCHNVLAWSQVAYRHTTPRYPGEHRLSLTCVQCHASNSEQIPWSSPANAPACAGCHERNYQPAPHTKYGNVKYTARELQNCAGACHVYSDASLKSIIKLRPGPQHSVNSGQF